jgi:photosystem II stability/assembly factor-like uncharacterized protein
MFRARFFASLFLLAASSEAAAPAERMPAAAAAWSTHGPASGGVSSLAVDPSDHAILYATTPFRGLLKSEDTGDHWRPISPPGSAPLSGPFAVAPSRSLTLYAFESNDLYRSDDGGDSWLQISRVPDSGSVNLVVVDPTDRSTVYAAATQALAHGLRRLGLYKSGDGGQDWTLLPLSGWAVGRLVIDPSHPWILYATDGFVSIQRSGDGGQSWTSVTPSFQSPANDVALDPIDPTIVYGCFASRVYQTRDAGVSWTAIGTSLPTDVAPPTPILRLAIDPLDPQTIYAGTRSGLFRSDDLGETWIFLTREIQTVLAVDPTQSSTLYGAPLSSYGGAMSVDRGATWSTLQTGEIATWISALAVPPGVATLYAVGYGAGRRAASYRSDDSGASWTMSRFGLPDQLEGAPSCLAIDPNNPSTLFAGWSGYSRADSPGLFRSETAGLTWSAFGEGLPDGGVDALVIDPRKPRTMYAGTFDGVYRSDDGGATWRPSNTGQSDSIVALAIDPANSARLYAAGSHQFFRSVDGGATWTGTPLVVASPVGTTSYGVRAIEVDPNRALTLYLATSSGLLRSTDGAITWAAVGTGFFGDPVGSEPNLSAVALDASRPGVLWVGTKFGRIFRSIDSGESWVTFERGLPGVEINGLVLDPASAALHAATAGRGIYDARTLPSRPAPRAVRPR